MGEGFFDKFLEISTIIYNRALEDGRLLRPSQEELRSLALQEKGVIETVHGAIAAWSDPVSRSKMHTKNNIDNIFGDEEAVLLKDARTRMANEDLICLDFIVANGPEPQRGRAIVPISRAAVLYGISQLFDMAATPFSDPDYTIVMFFDDDFKTNPALPLKEKKVMIRNAHSEDGRGVKIIRNSGYLGEIKKGPFTFHDWWAKASGTGIFLHSGCRQDRLYIEGKGYVNKSSLVLALSANGKTTTSCSVIARKNGEESWLIQDDGGILTHDGSFRGFEGKGLFVKTDGVTGDGQVEILYALLSPHAYYENVFVDADGIPDFANVDLTRNGRAIVRRADVMHAQHAPIDVPSVDYMFMITRGETMPAVSKLTTEEAVAYMVLGQSIQSSAGNPEEAGKIINSFFYDPFIAGDRAEHANLFYSILKANPGIQCYLINTGYVGPDEVAGDIGIVDTMSIMGGVLRDSIPDSSWKLSETSGLLVPSHVQGVKDPRLFEPAVFYDKPEEFLAKQRDLDRHRAELVGSYASLDQKVVDVFAQRAE